MGFNPRSPCGERQALCSASRVGTVFQPTLPLRGATSGQRHDGHQRLRVSTHAPLAGSDRGWTELELAELVSTHAPLAGSDLDDLRFRAGLGGVSTHAPLAGSDLPLASVAIPSRSFQPTLPLRGATWRSLAAPLGGVVSTHAPLAGSDKMLSVPWDSAYEFQPTLPLRGATTPTIRPLRLPICFNPRSPCGERPKRRRWRISPPCFNPRSPCGERRQRHDGHQRLRVSTHAPLAGSDRGWTELELAELVSTHAPLAGSDLDDLRFRAGLGGVSTHAPLAGSDPLCGWRCRIGCGFNPRSPCGERPSPPPPRPSIRCFNPRSPCGERRVEHRGSGYGVGGFQPTLPLRGAT